jgi:AcrR family transcriptional regulator
VPARTRRTGRSPDAPAGPSTGTGPARPGGGDPSSRLGQFLPRLPPDQGQPDGTAGLILATGLQLFAQKGYHATSIRDIGLAMGLTAANLYAHFPSKEHLLAELVRRGHEAHHRALCAALLESGPLPLQQLQSLVRAHVRMHAEYAMLAVVAHTELHALSPELQAPAVAIRKQSEALLTGVMARGQQQRVFHLPQPFVVAAAIGGMGLRVAHWYHDGLGLTLDQVADVHAELATRMVSPWQVVGDPDRDA